jgi:MYXO-CTERM domain-containing protein
MKARDVVLTILFLPLLATAAPSSRLGSEASTENAGMYRYQGCGDNLTPLFGAMIGFGALAGRRRRTS